MAVNIHKNHLVVFLEDTPYREIMNGVKLSLNINSAVIDVKSPSGGWLKVFAALDDNSNLLKNRETMYALLLVDFDNSFEDRVRRFKDSLSETDYQNRVFILGVDKKESEDLKKSLQFRNYEEIGKALVRDCPQLTNWQNQHLECNVAEIKRMIEESVFSWLFNQ